MAISVGTVHRWKHRTSPEDHSCCPLNIKTAFDAEEQALILCLHQKGLALDDLVDLVQPPLPDATRSSVYRLLHRNGVSRLPKKAEQEKRQNRKQARTTSTGSSRTMALAACIWTVSTC